MRKMYPSDITREQFEIIRPILEGIRKVTHPRNYDLYDIFCAVLYLLKEGCRWRSLPHDFPKWNNVYYHYAIWKKKGEDGESPLDKALAELVLSERIINGRNPKPSMTIVDSKSIKNTYTAEEKGYDGGKKISGVKLHIGVDILGLPNGIHVTKANVGDREGALKMLELYAPKLSNILKVLVDGGYTGEPFANAVMALKNAVVEVAKRSELHKFEVIPKRWIVERSFGWLEHCRRLWKNCERHLHTLHQMVTLAFISLLLRRY
jgi:transposase